MISLNVSFFFFSGPIENLELITEEVLAAVPLDWVARVVY